VAGQVYQLFILRFVHGLFTGGILPALNTLVTLNSPEDRRGGVMGIARSGLLLGHILGPVLGGYFSAFFGIPLIFVLTGALLILVTLIAGLTIREPGAA
jgi:MFS family permease